MKQQPGKRKQSSDADKTAIPGGSMPPALPPARSHPARDPHRVDVTGKAPEDIRIDPDLTEGHPGYEESGDSEIIPVDRLAKGSSSEKRPPKQ